MQSRYVHTCIWINGRKVSMADIVSSRVEPLSEFETSTFEFIARWMSGEEVFKLTTSGSTGTPKEISVTRKQMVTSSQLTCTALSLHSDLNALVCLDTKFIAGKMMLVRCLETGMRIFAIDPCSNPLMRLPIDETMHFTAMVPLQVKTIIESSHPHIFDQLSICIAGGANVSDELRSKLQKFTVNVYATYGMTETLSHVALQSLNGDSQSDFFQALPQIRLGVDDRQCLVINAPHFDQEIVTNDIVDLKNDHEFRWLGRYDNVINSGGLKISPEHVEQKIGKIFTRLRIPNPFFVFALPDERLGQKAVLVVEEPTLTLATIDSIYDSMLLTFSPYEIPRQIFQSDHFLYTPTSKVKRQDTFSGARPVFTFTRE
jgi:O-succinylbenzoic acid--CoA ligase